MSTAPDSLTTLIFLALFGLAGGVGITAIGPGGVLPTIGMFLLSGLTPAGVAGTAIATHVATGVLGTAAYTRSGQLKDPATRRTALLLAASAVVGTPVGALVNTAISSRTFGLLLAGAVAVTGLLVFLRERRVGATEESTAAPALAPLPTLLLGAGVSTAAGMFGLGGPMLSVPLLVLLGMPVLGALAAAQAQSVVIASIGTLAYAQHGSIDWRLALIVGVPELAGVIAGWRIARALPGRHLKLVLAGTLLALAPYLALHS